MSNQTSAREYFSTLTGLGLEGRDIDDQKVQYLYKQSISNVEETEIDRISRSKMFNLDQLEKNEPYSYNCAEIFYRILKVFVDKQEYKQLMTEIKIYQEFDTKIPISVILGEDNQYALFENILCNYLYKQKLNNVLINNSSTLCGKIVNLVLENLNSPIFIEHKKCIMEKIFKYFGFIQRIIILNFVSLDRKPENEHLNIKIQKLKIENNTQISSLEIIRTFITFLQLQQVEDTKLLTQILQKISLTCWHSIILLMVEKRTNNILLVEIYSIFELLIKYGSTATISSVLFRLNLIQYMSKVMEEYLNNGVKNQDLPLDVFYKLMDKFFSLLALNFQIRKQELAPIKVQLQGLRFWSIISQKFPQINQFDMEYQQQMTQSKLMSRIFNTNGNINNNSQKGFISVQQTPKSINNSGQFTSPNKKKGYSNHQTPLNSTQQKNGNKSHIQFSIQNKSMINNNNKNFEELASKEINKQKSLFQLKTLQQ